MDGCDLFLLQHIAREERYDEQEDGDKQRPCCE